jgi:hypothetical protein
MITSPVMVNADGQTRLAVCDDCALIRWHVFKGAPGTPANQTRYTCDVSGTRVTTARTACAVAFTANSACKLIAST